MLTPPKWRACIGPEISLDFDGVTALECEPKIGMTRSGRMVLARMATGLLDYTLQSKQAIMIGNPLRSSAYVFSRCFLKGAWIVR
jgi:hypothetical protein